MKRKGALWAIVFTAAVIMLLYLMQITDWRSGDMAAPGKALREFAWPIKVVSSVIDDGLRRFFSSFVSRRVLLEENIQLKASLEAAEYWMQQMRELQEENRRLGLLLEFKTSQDRMFDLLVARVIGKDGDNWNQTITLDKGSSSGLSSDMAVLAPAGMVGRIVSVTAHTAEVLLLIDRASSVGARIMETRFSPGMVSGTGQDDVLEMLRVDKDAEIEPGQTVITSGYGSVFPKGLLIGIVEEVKPDLNGLTQRATIKPSVDFRRLEEVMIIRGLLLSEEDALSAELAYDHE